MDYINGKFTKILNATDLQTQINELRETVSENNQESITRDSALSNRIEVIDSTKQDTLISGKNIRTLNKVSLLGAGNINIKKLNGVDLVGPGAIELKTLNGENLLGPGEIITKDLVIRPTLSDDSSDEEDIIYNGTEKVLVKLVTSDTAQTITGAKTFANDILLTINNQNSPTLSFRNGGGTHTLSVSGAGNVLRYYINGWSGPGGASTLDINFPANSGTLALQEAFASAYDSTRTYTIGDKVTHFGKFYKCNTADTTGTWSSSNWTEISVNNSYVDLDTNQTILGNKTFGTSSNPVSLTIYHSSGSSYSSFNTYGLTMASGTRIQSEKLVAAFNGGGGYSGAELTNAAITLVQNSVLGSESYRLRFPYHKEGTFALVEDIAALNIENGTGTNSLQQKGCIASGDSSHAEGNYTEASGNYSHAEGNYTKATGTAAHAEGQSSTASGGQSHAEGNYNTASGACSHAEGQNSTASGITSHAEGQDCVASGVSSYASGTSSTASADLAFARGFQNTTSNWGGATLGRNLISSCLQGCEIVVGQYNDNSIDNTSNPQFVVGIGADANHRSNGLVVYRDGTVQAKTQIKIGNTVITEVQLQKLLALLDTLEAKDIQGE